MTEQQRWFIYFGAIATLLLAARTVCLIAHWWRKRAASLQGSAKEREDDGV